MPAPLPAPTPASADARGSRPDALATNPSRAPGLAKGSSKPGDPAGTTTGGPGGAGGQGGDAKPLVGWAELKVGSLVLAQDDEDGAYYFARIVATKADDHVVLAWENYPDLPEFSRARWALALLHPEVVARVLTP